MEITVNRNLRTNLSGLNTSPLNDNLNDDEFAFTRAEKIKLAHLTTGSTGGGGGIASATPITYTELVALADASGFTAEQTYLITDYQTVHYMFDGSTRLDEINTSSIEPLLIKAATVNAIYPEAYSTLYPQDIIHYDFKSDYWIQDIAFANAENIGGSLLKPDLTNVILIPGYKGVIYKREDTKNNVIIGYDFRNVKFRRFATEYDIANGSNIYWGLSTDASGVTDPSVYMDCLTFHETDEWNAYEVSVKNIIIDNIHDTYLNYNGNIGSSLSNNVFYLSGNNSSNQGYLSYDNKLGSFFELNTIGSHFNINTIGDYFNSNIIGNDFSFNIIGTYFGYNIIGNNNVHNTFGDNNNYHTFSDNNNYNTFGGNNNNIILTGSNCTNNTFGNYNNQFILTGDNHNNIFEDENYEIRLGNGSSYNVIGCVNSNINFGVSNSHNKLGNYNTNNTFGNNCTGNKLGNYNTNTFGDNCTGNKLWNYNTNNTFGNNCTGNTFGHLNDTNTFGQGSTNNTFGKQNNNNTFGDYAYHNTFGDNNYDNTFGDYNTNNIFGNNNSSNTFIYNNNNNTFGNNCTSNILHTPLSGNTFGVNFSNNNCYNTSIFKNNIINNNITSIDFTSATHVFQPYTCTLYVDSSGNKKLIYDGDTIVDANA